MGFALLSLHVNIQELKTFIQHMAEGMTKKKNG
jgi:hypothetical protein